MIDAAQIARCEELVAAVAPELLADPLYIYSLPDGVLDRGSARAFASSSLPNYLLREHLEETGQWQGPGHHITFCRDLDGDELLSVTAHEVAHLLPRKEPAACDSIELSERAEILSVVAASFAGVPTDKPRWLPKHGASFVRRCIHIHHRACEAGYPILMGDIVFAGIPYELQHHSSYAIALGDEPRRMMGKSFAEIEATPPPSKFRQLFIADSRDWHHAHAQEVHND